MKVADGGRAYGPKLLAALDVIRGDKGSLVWFAWYGALATDVHPAIRAEMATDKDARAIR